MKFIFKNIFAILLLFAFVVEADSPVKSSLKIEVGEELTYVVSYTIFELGEVKIKIEDKYEEDGVTYYKTSAKIDSYPGVPFVDLHQVYESIFDSEINSKYFKGSIFYEEDTSFTEYFFNDNEKNIRILKTRTSKKKRTDSTTTYDKQYQDGLSLFYFARKWIGTDNEMAVPCFVNDSKENTRISFYNDEVHDVSIDAVDYDIACLRLDGKTDFVSIFGLTGYFEGWFSNDEYAVPIVANMQVIIGNITLELKNWKKKGWKPPRYED